MLSTTGATDRRGRSCLSLENRDTVLVVQNVVETHTLATRVLGRLAPYHCTVERKTQKQTGVRSATSVRRTGKGREEGREYSQLELLGDLLVDGIAKVFDGALAAPENDRRTVVRWALPRLGVHTNQVEHLPHLFDELIIHVPPVLARNGDRVGNLVEQVELLNRDAVNLVKHVNRGHVDSVALNDVNQLLYRSVLAEGDVSV